MCGYGEPLLHKDISYIVKKLSNVSKVEIITNGDVLNLKRLIKLFESGLSTLLVSVYDGPKEEDFKLILSPKYFSLTKLYKNVNEEQSEYRQNILLLEFWRKALQPIFTILLTYF